MASYEFEDSDDYYSPEDYDMYYEEDSYSRSGARSNYYYEFDLRYYDYYDYSYYSQWTYYYTPHAVPEYDDYYYGYGDYYSYEDYYMPDDLEPLWYEFIVNDDEINSWGVVMTYDENLSEFYLWTSGDDICQLNVSPDFTYFTVEDCPECSCAFAEEYEWY